MNIGRTVFLAEKRAVALKQKCAWQVQGRGRRPVWWNLVSQEECREMDIGLAKKFVWIFHTTLWENPDELFRQHNSEVDRKVDR